jgi:hypothetical protein
MTEHVINLDTTIFYAFSVKDPDGLPALEWDPTTGSYNILVFTSYDSAYRYALLQKPSLIESIVELTRTQGPQGKQIQSSLIKIARFALFKAKNISGIIFDHPGHTKAASRYITIEDFVKSHKTKVSRNTVYDFINRMEEEDKAKKT